MVVSHDSGFLDAVCTDIVHYEKDKKLKHYKVWAAPHAKHCICPTSVQQAILCSADSAQCVSQLMASNMSVRCILAAIKYLPAQHKPMVRTV
jgi:hypothetical protein